MTKKKLHEKALSRDTAFTKKVVRLTQPEPMRTSTYQRRSEQVDGNDAWALFYACAAGELATVKALIKKNPRLVTAQYWYQFPIHMAVREGHLDIVKLLLESGADPGQAKVMGHSWGQLLAIAKERGHGKLYTLLEAILQERFGYSPQFDRLRIAMETREIRRVQAVLRKHPKLARATDTSGNNAIHWAVAVRQLEFIDHCLGLGADINAMRADGNTPLSFALDVAHTQGYRDRRIRLERSYRTRNTWAVAGYLLAKGADYTLSAAAALGDLKGVEQFLRCDPGLAHRLDSSRVSSLTYAAREGYTDIVQLLLDHGSDPNMPESGADDGGALFGASAGNHLDTAKLLLERGANPNAGVDACGCCLTIVEYHNPGNFQPMQQLLREHGAYTPPYAMSADEMKQALREGHEVVRHEEFLGNVMRKDDADLLALCLEKDSSIVNRMHMHGANAYPKSPALIRTLLARGLDPNKPDWLGRTFLHTCVVNADCDGAAVFLEAGAEINARDLEFKGTPLATAVRYEPWCRLSRPDDWKEQRKRTVEFLLGRGAKTNLPDDEPWATPLAWAKKKGLKDIAAILRKHGAKK